MGDFEVSQKIQKMVFPNGVKWDKENRAYLTEFGNLSFDLMFSVSNTYKNEAAQKKDESCDLSSLVAEVGLEPHDLQVMSLTSYQLLYSAIYHPHPSRVLHHRGAKSVQI